jgi:hypothetical protein
MNQSQKLQLGKREQVERHSKGSIASITVRRMMVKVALSFPILTLLALGLGNRHSTDSFSSHSLKPLNRHSSLALPHFQSSLYFTLSAEPCTLETQYQSQPTAECQTTYDTHRLTVFLIASQSLMVLLLSAILIMQFRSR